jgi:hypothetical protein
MIIHFPHKLLRIHTRTTTSQYPLPLSLLRFANIYKVSLSSLFILAILPETDRSMVRSPISTTRPPLISGLTLETTLSFSPCWT